MGKSSKTTVAVIGHACRFPGNADTPQKFWSLLLGGTDAVTQVPADRFDQRRYFHPDPAVRGRSYTFAAGTIGDVSGFDATFFGVSAREAEQMDPQQRLLLELTQEALERGGQIPARLAGSDCAVFVGVSTSEYADRRINDLAQTDSHTMLGATFSILANRISYLFDLRGPSMAIDTACSSSLVALNEAVQTLQSGRSRMAIVGAVNLLLSPAPFVGFSKARMLAPDGRCRAFAKDAEGYVRAEGGGVLVLKPLEDAQRDGDPILAIIRGVEINTDGRTAGMALPASEAQRALLQTAYGLTNIIPSDISYFEAHGTGTAVGDPAEAQAIGQAIGAYRPKTHPLLIGSVKTNIGHLEAAAGMAGLIKAIEILRHDVVPPSLHSRQLNPEIDFDGLNIQVVQEAMPLPAPSGRKIVGVSSFGFGGTNAHAVLEAYGSPSVNPHSGREIELPLTLSARTEEALAQQIKAFSSQLVELDPFDWHDFAYTAACRRPHHEHRLLLRAKSTKHAAKLLESVSPKNRSKGVAGRHGKTALVFTGNGAQWFGMGRTLFVEDSVFREALEQFDAIARWRQGWSVIQAMHFGDARIEDSRTAQPLLFALQVALVKSMQAKGLTFDGVVGHSVGEVAAAYFAGALSLEQAIWVIRERSDAQAATYDLGRMMVVGMNADSTRAELASSELEIAAINSSRSTTVSGPTDSIIAMEKHLKGRGVATKLLDINYAFHSSQQDCIREPLLAALAGLEPSETERAFYSTVTGAPLSGSLLGPDYWWQNVRNTVRFSDAIAAMEQDGYRVFIEVGPHALLQGNLRQILKQGRPIATLTRDHDGLSAVQRALDDAYRAGATIDFAKAFPKAGRVLDLPTYPWQRDRHWHKPTSESLNGISSRLESPFLGLRVTSGADIWENVLDAGSLPCLKGHKVGGNLMVPAAGFIEIALEAGAALFGNVPIEIEGLEILKALVLDVPRSIRTTVAEGGYFRIEAREFMRTSAWSIYATGRLVSVTSIPDISIAPSSENSVLYSAEAHYGFAEARGFDYSDEFKVLKSVNADFESAIGQLKPLEAPADHRVHIGHLDGVLQTIFPILQRGAENPPSSVSYLPRKIGRIFFHPGRAKATRTGAIVRRAGAKSLSASGVLRNQDGLPILILKDIRLSPLTLTDGRKSVRTAYDQVLEPLPPVRPTPVPDLAAHAAIVELKKDSPSQRTKELLDQQSAAFAADALLQLGEATPGNLNLLAKTLDIAQNYASEDWTAEEKWRENLIQRPDLIAELNFIGRFGRSLAKQLAGADEPTDLTAARQRLLETGALAKTGCRKLITAVEHFLLHWPKGRQLRALQVGAGSGGFSEDLWDLLSPARADLVIVERSMERRKFLSSAFDGNNDVTVVDQVTSNSAMTFDLVIAAYADLPEDIDSVVSPGALLVQAQIERSDWTRIAFASPSNAISDTWLSRDEVSYDGIDLSWARFPMGGSENRPVPPKEWTIISAAPERIAAHELTAALTAHGHRATVTEFSGKRGKYQYDNVIFLAGQSGELETQLQRAATLLKLLQRNQVSELILVLRDALSGYSQNVCVPERAAIAGIIRVLQNENPRIGCRIIDVRCSNQIFGDLLAEEIVHGSENEVVIGSDGRFAPRLSEIPASADLAAETGTIALKTTGSSFNQLRWVPLAQGEIGPDQVEIAVAAAGLNFRDVMYAMGLLPADILESGFAGPTLGMEAAGTVTRIGPKVANVAVGDKVICFAPSSLANRVVTRSDAVISLPKGLDFAQGATLVTAAFTVTYALSRLAKLSRGERILIHGGAGGVGIAAIQYAQAAGAEIFATAGSEDKRDFLKLMGIPETHVLNSRSLDFANQIRALTDGEGVDVVLNSLAGEGVHRGLSLLKPLGRFIELGKTDFVSNSKIGLNYFRNNITYFGVDADQIMSAAPQIAMSVLQEVEGLIATGVFLPLPYCEFSWRRAADAFHYMKRARHIGKVIIKPPTIRQERPKASPDTKILPHASYIVTGGLKGLGLASAQWLVDRGATHVVLVSRTGIADDAALATIEALRRKGAIIDIRTCDVSERSSVDRLIDEFRFNLKGIIHAATVYEDGAIHNLSPESFDKVIAVKARGALLLDQATRDIALDLFVLYSSVSSVIGNPGQASYVAANMVLVSLADRRKAQGHAAQIVALAPISDTGHLADKPQLVERFAKIGVQPLTSKQVLAGLDEIVLQGKKVFLLADINWPKLRAALPLTAAPKFRKLSVGEQKSEGAPTEVDFGKLAASLSATELQPILLEHMSEVVGQILHVSADKLDQDCSVFDLGMDSLMGLELRMAIEKRFGVTLPLLGLSQDISVHRAAEIVQSELRGAASESRPATEITPESEKAFILTRHGEHVSVGAIADAIEDVRQGTSKRLIV